MSTVKLHCPNQKIHCGVQLHKLAKGGEMAPYGLDKPSTACKVFITIIG